MFNKRSDLCSDLKGKTIIGIGSDNKMALYVKKKYIFVITQNYRPKKMSFPLSHGESNIIRIIQFFQQSQQQFWHMCHSFLDMHCNCVICRTVKHFRCPIDSILSINNILVKISTNLTKLSIFGQRSMIGNRIVRSSNFHNGELSSRKETKIDIKCTK